MKKIWNEFILDFFISLAKCLNMQSLKKTFIYVCKRIFWCVVEGRNGEERSGYTGEKGGRKDSEQKFMNSNF